MTDKAKTFKVGDIVRCVYKGRVVTTVDKAMEELGAKDHTVTEIYTNIFGEQLLSLEGVIHPSSKGYCWIAKYFELVEPDSGFSLSEIDD